MQSLFCILLTRNYQSFQLLISLSYNFKRYTLMFFFPVSGDLYSWGSNENGCLGLGYFIYRFFMNFPTSTCILPISFCMQCWSCILTWLSLTRGMDMVRSPEILKSSLFKLPVSKVCAFGHIFQLYVGHLSSKMYVGHGVLDHLPSVGILWLEAHSCNFRYHIMLLFH